MFCFNWNKYFTKYGMEIPAYAHKIEAKKGKSGKAQFAASGNERSTAAVRGSTAPEGRGTVPDGEEERGRSREHRTARVEGIAR